MTAAELTFASRTPQKAIMSYRLVHCTNSALWEPTMPITAPDALSGFGPCGLSWRRRRKHVKVGYQRTASTTTK